MSTMRNRKLLGVGGAIILAAALAWFARASIATAFAFILAHATVALAILAIIILVLGYLWIQTDRRSRSVSRDLNEVMRVAQKNARLQAFETPPIAPALSEPDLPPATPASDGFPRLNVIRGGKDKPVETASSVTPKAQRRFSRELFFQPVFAMPEGAVIGYDVFRQIKSDGRIRPDFVRDVPDRSASARAAFEYAMFEQASVAARHIICLPDDDSAEARLFIPLSDALIDDKTLWPDMIKLLKAHKALCANLVFCINTAIYAEKKTSGTRKKATAKLADTGVGMAAVVDSKESIAGIDAVTDLFETLIMDRDALFGIRYETPNALFETFLENRAADFQAVFCRGVTSDAEIVDCLDRGVTLVSGNFLAPPRKLRSDIKTPASEAEAGAKGSRHG